MRAVFLPIAVALGSVYCASLVPPPGWQESFGLGGHFGDMMMGGVMTLLPFGAAASLKIGALLMAAGAIAFYGFVLGFDLSEARRLGRWLWFLDFLHHHLVRSKSFFLERDFRLILR